MALRKRGADAADKDPEATKTSLRVMIFALITLMSGSGLQISGKRMGNALPEHMFAILLLAVFLISGAFFGAAYVLAGRRGLDAQTLRFPKRQYAAMAVFDTMQMMLTMLAQPHVPGKVKPLTSAGL